MLKDILKSGVGRATSHGLQILAMPIITRLFSPDAFGAWVLFHTIIIIAGVFATWRLETALVLDGDDRVALRILKAIALNALIVSTLVSLIALIFSSHVFDSILESSSFQSKWMGLLFLAIFPYALNQVFINWCIRKKNYIGISIISLSIVAFTIGIQILIGLVITQNSLGLIFGTVAGETIACFIGWAILSKSFQLNDHIKDSFQSLCHAVQKYQVYPLFMTPYGLTSHVRNRAVLFLVEFFTTKYVVGIYSFCYRVLSLPVNLVSEGMRPVFFKTSTEVDSKRLEVIVNRSVYLLGSLVIPIYILCVIEAPLLFEFVFGSEWAEAGELSRYMAPAYLILILTNWLDRLFDSSGKQKLLFMLEVIYSLIFISSFTFLLISKVEFRYIVAIQMSLFSLYLLTWALVLYWCRNFQLRGFFRILATLGIQVLVFLSFGLALKHYLPLQIYTATYLSLALVVSILRWKKIKSFSAEPSS